MKVRGLVVTGRVIPQALLPRVGTLTIFEQVLLLNSGMILGSTVMAYWVTHAAPSPYHEVLVTVFLILATLIGVGTNAVVLRRAFRPLHTMTATIAAIHAGAAEQRIADTEAPADIAQVAVAFNEMLDALETQRQLRNDGTLPWNCMMPLARS
jgi:two-component system, NarL family, sensor histidine kinase UhpB